MDRTRLPLTAAFLAVATVVTAASQVVVIPLPPEGFSFAMDVNDRGDVVGVHSGGSFDTRAFMWTRGKAAFFTVPGSSYTDATGLNERGDVVGTYADDDGLRGYMRTRKGRFFRIDVPDAVVTSPEDVNRRRQVVGHFTQLLPNTDPWIRGFLLDAGGVRILENPFGGFFTLPQAIDDRGTIVGWYGGTEGDDPRSGFILRGTRWTAVNYPGADQTYVNGIGSDGTVVGYAVFFFREQPEVGFVYRNGTFKDLPPGFQGYGVNESGTVVGMQFTPVEPFAQAAAVCSPLRARGKCRLLR